VRQQQEVKANRETSQFFTYQKRVMRIGLPPRDETYWRREEMMIFKSARVSAGINFDLYDKVDVDRRGGKGDELPCKSFKDVCTKYELDATLAANIDRCGYNVPTPVQKHAMPAGLDGTDVMVAAQTGSGKTAAFLVPIIQAAIKMGATSVQEGPMLPTSVIMAPTRELCQQTAMEARRLCYRTPLRVCSLYGGADALPQLKQLAEGCELLVCTPGRLEDFLQRGVITMRQVRYLVLDEADRMLDMGFEPQIRNIIEEHAMPESGSGPGERQTMMFSATFPREIQDLALDFLDPTYLWVGVGRVGLATNTVEQRFVDVSTTTEDGKFDTLLDAVREVRGEGGSLSKCLIFANNKATVDDLVWRLSDNRVRAAQVHGGLTQAARDRSMGDFKNGRVSVMVATDVAARGLDMPGIDHVINYDLPGSSEDYVHRIGRTGRIGNTGVSTSFVTGWEPALRNIIRQIQSTNAQKKEDGEAVAPIPSWVVEQAERSTGSTNRYGGGFRKRPGEGRPEPGPYGTGVHYRAPPRDFERGNNRGGFSRDRVGPGEPQSWAKGLPPRRRR
jgi:ATP-dependent RNA helicase DDX3X